jgi:anti-sigma-K factor RskA
MDDDRMDLTPLDPAADRARFERVVAGIADRVAPSLRARRMRRNVWGELAAWRRPVLTAAALLAVAATAVIARVPRAGTAGGTSAAGSLIEAAGMPSRLAGIVESSAPPGPSDVVGL